MKFVETFTGMNRRSVLVLDSEYALCASVYLFTFASVSHVLKEIFLSLFSITDDWSINKLVLQVVNETKCE